MKRINLAKIKVRAAGGILAALATMMMFSPMTAYAQSHEDEAEEEPVVEEVTEEPEEEPEEPMGPLTPDGNLTLVDDYGSPDKSGKQFITVVTKSGNYFYIIIDRDDEGEETVHFLNMVDEADLLALMDDEQVEEYLAATQPKEEPAPVVEEPKEDPEPEEPEEPKEKPKSPVGKLVLVIILIVGGAAGYMFFKKSKQVKPKTGGPDPDADYDESDEDYLNSLPDDDDIPEPEESDEEDEEE